MNLWEDYAIPETIEEALETFSKAGDSAALVAGGTDLLIDLQEEGVEERPKLLIDVTAIPDLQGIHIREGQVTLGAATTHAEVISHEELRRVATALVEGCQVIGGPQVRNVATIGGNVAHALPAADSMLGLLAFDAEAQIATLTEGGDVTKHWVPLQSLFAGPGKNTLVPYRELIISFRFEALEDGSGSAFRRIMRPQGIALPIMGLACKLVLDDEKEVIQEARIVPGPIAPVPTRAVKTEEVLVGERVDQEVFRKAEEIAWEECHPRTSKHRATSEYRKWMISRLMRKALSAAASRAQTGEILIDQPFIGERGVRPSMSA
ncbi:MAG: FAD binding domain-containing protein [Anaerolineales bacterium]